MRKGRYRSSKFAYHLYEPSEIIEEHLAMGNLGVKPGKGFYDHSDNLDRLIEDRNRNMIKIMQVLKEN